MHNPGKEIYTYKAGNKNEWNFRLKNRKSKYLTLKVFFLSCCIIGAMYSWPTFIAYILIWKQANIVLIIVKHFYL